MYLLTLNFKIGTYADCPSLAKKGFVPIILTSETCEKVSAPSL